MANTIIIKNSSTAAAVPTSGDLEQGELAVNVTDKKIYTKDSGNNIVAVGGAQQFLGTADIKAIAYNAQSIAEDITILATLNGLSAGPVSVNSGFTVTIESGGSWTVV